MCTYIYIYMAAAHELVTGRGGLFATRLVTESGVLHPTLPATSLLRTAVLYAEAHDKGL